MQLDKLTGDMTGMIYTSSAILSKLFPNGTLRSYQRLDLTKNKKKTS